ncbi:hypothetical protein PM3016_6664 [Paenibacillus mucilaginosus 3016]|uniref:Uncharacterized protein n=1 Tax=Paenibacillus mucilaginosus 3016 TaxID=1116391 RepID=H6NMB5_9BACL|nr:hypothetical protein [Paenibacillus mucilaginosus]AFC33277.1 hypothetical protein PM3016_6664 [Paenibacillus mucilaginosus 3016]WFA21699.1 hypothetical protein ERY13_33115 [Paenibacillus mucilaginosus]
MERIMHNISEQISLDLLGAQLSQQQKFTVLRPESACTLGADEQAVHENQNGSSTLAAPLLREEEQT